MNVVVEDAGTCRKKVNIEWPAERVQADYDKLLAEYCKAAKIKGFRPGKAPRQLVEKRYGKDILEDLRDRLVPEGYQSAVKEKALNVVQVMDVDEPTVKRDEPLSFSVTVEVAPDFDLPTYKGIALQREKAEVDASKVDETIDNIAEQFASFDEVEGRPIARGDLVQVDYEGTVDGQSIEELSEETKGLGTREDFWVRADENAFLPEFADGLPGANVGDELTISVAFPDDFAAGALAGKQGEYKVKVKGIREKKLPERDDTFFKRLGVDDEANLRERIEADLKQAAEQRETSRLRNAIIDELIKELAVDLPPSAVSRETSQIIQDVIRENSERGAKEDQLMEKKDEILEMAGRNAETRVKAQFVLDRIADEEKITVSPQEMRAHLERMAAGYRMTADALRSELKKRDAMENVEAELRRSMTVDFLLEHASISE